MPPLLRTVLVLAAAFSPAGAEPLRVALIAPSAEVAVLAALGATIEDGGLVRISTPARADALLILRGPGAAAAETRTLLADGRPAVVLGAEPAAWNDAGGFITERIGAIRGAAFAGGAPLRVINLFAHPVLTGVEAIESDEAVPVWTKLAEDAQLIVEGITGEETTPLAWVRNAGSGRIAHLVPTSPALLTSRDYLRIVTQALLWTARRPIPGARPVVQRTFMPESHPGAFAITFPEGVGVCLDPVRGGVNFAWDGDFVDLRPRWLTKQGAPARIFGSVFYSERAPRPLRAGAPGANSAWRFLGHGLRDGTPEFRYDVDGREITEALRALPDGTGFTRTLSVAAGKSPLWLTLEEQSNAEVIVEGASRDGNAVAFTSADAGSFRVTVRRRGTALSP
ncbi:MAG: hypothetical protein RIR76_2390 [Verrucomicrobiota bacterium]|jgi:hypothetical protein|nr:hypothetical protein [Opitutaceae bacterium]